MMHVFRIYDNGAGSYDGTQHIVIAGDMAEAIAIVRAQYPDMTVNIDEKFSEDLGEVKTGYFCDIYIGD